MAEFLEVHRQFDRMCWYYQRKCECPMGCPMNGVNISQCRKIAFELPEVTEKTVMSWAAEHPAPTYPSWYRWLIMMGAIGSVEDLFSDLQREIPADIAQKLGIEPKEG